MLDKTRTHLRDHRSTYIAVGVTAVVASSATALLLFTKGDVTNTVRNFRLFSPGDNNTEIVNLVRRGYPGLKILDKETGEVTASLTKMAENVGKSRAYVANHPERFKILGEMS